MASVWLAVLALVLAGPVPALLARAAWPRLVPRAAVVLWQAVALAAVLAAVGSVLAAPEELLRASTSPAERSGVPWLVAVAVAAVLAGLIVVRLLGVLGLLAVRTRRRRTRHRDLVDLLDQAERSTSLGASRSGAVLRVLDGGLPFAYCVPGRAPRVVVTGGALDTLDADELRAVLAHEQAHLDARHDLVREAFTALHHAFPVVVRSREARDAVALLLEMLADDAGGRVHGAAAMAGALDAFLATSRTPDAEVVLRRDRVRDRAHGRAHGDRALAILTYIAAVALVVVPTVAVVIPWLALALPAAGLP